MFEIDHKTDLLIHSLCIGLKTFIQATTFRYVLDTPVAYFTSGGQTRPMEQIARTTTSFLLLMLNTDKLVQNDYQFFFSTGCQFI